MKTITHTGGTTYSSTTSVKREVPIIKNFPAVSGRVDAVNVSTSVRVDTAISRTYTVYLFKTFTGDPEYWETRVDNMYQYPGDTDHYLKIDYIGDVLASETFTEAIHSGTVTKTLTATEYGRQLKNWAGDVYLGIVSDSTGFYWDKGTTSTITINCMDGGMVRYCAGGEKVLCEVYCGSGGTFKRVEMRAGVGGVFVEIGE